MFGLSEVVVDVSTLYVEFVGKILQIAADVQACFGGSVIVVEIPIEAGLALLLKQREETLLNLLQEIEAYEEVGVV